MYICNGWWESVFGEKPSSGTGGNGSNRDSNRETMDMEMDMNKRCGVLFYFE